MKGTLRYLWIPLFVGLNKWIELLDLAAWVNYIIPGLLVLVFGLPHGATDHLLNNLVRTNQVSGKVTFSFLSIYLSIIAGYALVWWWSSAVALVIFLLLSAYHFGETQWVRAITTHPSVFLRKLHFSVWGVVLLGSLFVFYPVQTAYFLESIIDAGWVNKALNITRQYVLPASTLLMVMLTWVLYKRVSEWIHQGVAFAMFMLLFATTDLIYAFAVFFGLYHARDTIEVMIEELKQSKPTFDWRAFFLNATPFTALSIFGIGLVLVVFFYLDFQVHWVTLFFIMISLVTAPHMWIIERFYTTKNKKP